MTQIFNDLVNDLIGIYLEHKRNICEINSIYKLNETLFAINEPFFMQSEKEALIKDSNDFLINYKRRKRKKNKLNIYQKLLNDSQKCLITKIIEKVFNSVKELEIKGSDNSSAKRMAEMALKINNFNEYFETLLCNNNKIPIVLGQFLIPGNCSLMCCEVIHGLKVMQDFYRREKFEVSNNFTIIIDPPFSSNKSVKRKHCYQTDHNINILEMCKQLNLLIDLFPKKTIIRVCIWTTNREKDFVLNQMLSILGFECTHLLVWHKITRSGQSVKLRGGLEYLIIASRKTSKTKCLNGILISIPSAIHSHKPPLQELLNKLFSESCDKSVENTINTPVVEFEATSSEPDSDTSKLLSPAIYSPLNGLELYARYLNVGFHSIGFEALKLQHHSFYNLF
jgi:N6-adenosine-specific RNA methylase IME4